MSQISSQQSAGNAAADIRPELDAPPQGEYGLTRRSILLGFFGAALINAVTYYNDYVLNNTPIIGNNMPIGLLIMLFFFTLLINGPLSRFAPRWRFSTSEVAVSFSMILVSCAIPSSGLMRGLPAAIISPLWYTQSSRDFRVILERMHMPDWLMPTLTRPLPDAASDPVVTGFFGRWHDADSAFWLAWLTPVLSWGLFFFAFFGAIISTMALVYQQWVHNERLPFPLAQVQLALIEQPKPGRMLNSIFRSRIFWLAAISVFFIHMLNGMHQYAPKYVPAIPLSFDFRTMLSEGSWAYVYPVYKFQAIFFSVIGLAYFVSTSVSFSVWFFVVLGIAVTMVEGMYTGNMSALTFQRDQHVGAVLVFMMTILWVGRHHWLLVLKQAFRGWRKGEVDGPYLSHRMAFWGMVVCCILMTGWLYVAGATLLGAAALVLVIMTLFIVSAKVIAETGLLYVEMRTGLTRPWQLLVAGGISKPVTAQTFYLGSLLDSITWQHREPLGSYALHGMKISEASLGDAPSLHKKASRTGLKIVAAFIGVLIVCYFVSFAGAIGNEYRYASSVDKQALSPINSWATVSNPYFKIVEPTVQYENGAPPLRVNPIVQVASGAVVTAFLSVMRFLFSWWPLHPVGYLLMPTWPASKLWFSIFLGWLIKVLLVRFGGAHLYSTSRNFFIGLIVGEALTASFWMLTAIALSLLNIPYETVWILPV